MTHERCSELLRGYARGELPRELAAEVAAHLAGCVECRVEERAAAALAAAPEGRPMDDLERAQLHRALAQELFKPRANADVAVAAPGRAWARWIAPIAAAAAVLAAIAVMTTGGGSDETAQFSAEANLEDGGAADALDAAPAPDGGAESGGGRSRALGATADQGPDVEAQRRPAPEFDAGAGSLTTDDLSAIARSGRLFRAFASSYAPSDGAALYDELAGVLEDEAGGAGAEVAECAATLPQDGTIVPVYGALAEYDGRDALVLGFVTADPGSDELDRYLMWVWERGNCRQPIDTLFGELR